MRAYLTATLAAIVALTAVFGIANPAQARTTWSLFNQSSVDSDGDGLTDWKEINLYQTNPNNPDSDGDGAADGVELASSHDPNVYQDQQILPKHIYISLDKQELRYYTGKYLMDDFLVSTGIPGKDTPSGEFSLLAKLPNVLYEGDNYYYPDTKWNLMFKPTYYIHGAFWHSNFGTKMSHGCVNVSYQDVFPLYSWAEVGVPVTILEGDFPSNLYMTAPSHTLLLDGRTIYLVMDNKKYGFTTMAAFSGLGYTLSNLQKRSSSGIEQGYILSSASMPHVAGSWVIKARTVYYVAGSGLIPIPTWGIFLNNGGAANNILPANSADLSKPFLNLMQQSDPRVR